jgi:hypothetical protein
MHKIILNNQEIVCIIDTLNNFCFSPQFQFFLFYIHRKKMFTPSHSHPQLTTMNIEILSFLTQRIHTVTLIGTNDILTFSNIYPNVYYLVIKNTKMDSSAIVTNLVKCFPNLRSLNVQFRMSNDYFDSLNMILNGQHLPHLAVFTSNMIDQNSGISWKINEWLFDKTILKWRSISFYATSISNDQWTIWL